jgi:hypothetical protein
MPAATATVTATTTPEIHSTAPINGFTTIWGITINPSVIVLGIVLVTFLYLIWQGNKKNSFNIWDLFQDIKCDGTRVASGIKCAYQVSFLLSSWVIIDQEIKGSLSEGVFLAYLGTWCLSLIAKVVFDKQDPPKIPGVKS